MWTPDEEALMGKFLEGANRKNARFLEELTPHEQQLVFDLLELAFQDGLLARRAFSWLWQKDYTERPIDIQTFLEDSYYFGNSYEEVFPCWVQELKYVLDPSNGIREWGIGGGIGLGKTSAALMAIAFKAVNVTKLKNPQAYYGNLAGSIICFGLFSITLNKTDFALMRKAQEILTRIPYFKDKFKVVQKRKHGQIEEQIQFPRDIMLWSGSQPSHALSMDVFCAVLDEQNFREGVKRKAYKDSSAYKLYDEIDARIDSRFKKTKDPILINISSADTSMSFLADHVRMKQATNAKKKYKTFHFSRFAIWEARSKDYENEPRFRVAIGNRHISHRILEPSDPEPANLEVISVPESLRSKFEEDTESALKNYAGIDVVGEGKLIPFPEKLFECFERGADYGLVHPFTVDALALGLSDDTPIHEVLIRDVLTEHVGRSRRFIRHPDSLRFIHVDLSINGDSAGIGCSHISSSRSSKEFALYRGGETISFFVPEIEVDFLLEILPIPGDQIDFQKIVNFVIWLRDVLHMPIGRVSYDGFQSVHSTQLLKKNGFKNVKIFSCDKNDDAYLMTRSSILSGNLSCYHHLELESQILQLIHTVHNGKGRVDHLSGLKKDVCDGLAGSVHGCVTEGRQPGVSGQVLSPAVTMSVGQRTTSDRKPGRWVYSDYKLPRDKRIVDIAPRRPW